MSTRRPHESSAKRDGERAARIDEVVFEHIQARIDGEPVSDEELVASHPELMPELGQQLEMLSQMSDEHNQANTEQRANDSPAPTGSGALKIRCPHCHQPVEVVADTPFIDITCNGCGSHFSLAGEPTKTRSARSLKKLGHFELVERLGLGSFGTVWKARDTELDRTVAIKIPRQGKLDTSEVESFLREARAAAQLNHPNIVSVHEVGRENETLFIVSDFVRGVPLSDWLTGQKPTIREAAQLSAKIADALQHAHDAGVVHRDLKPQNIMLDSDGEPHLMDFGLARRDAGQMTMTMDGQVLGTPAYMSPEQAKGEAHKADHRTDVYSLGVILFELLTGELPFRGNTRMLIHQVLCDDAPSPRKLNGIVPKDLETICLKCMEKERNGRYPSADHVGDELRRYLNGEPIEARPTSLAQRAWRWCRRNPTPASLAMILALALTTGLAAVSLLWIGSEKTAEQLRRRLYTYSISRASAAQRDNNILKMRDVLDSCPEDLRHWEWNWLNHWLEKRSASFTLVAIDPARPSVQTPEMEQQGVHRNNIDVAIVENGKWIATSGQKGKIALWDASGNPIDALVGHAAHVRALAASPTAGLLASGDNVGTIIVWDVGLRRSVWTKVAHSSFVQDIDFSSDGNLIVSTGGDMTVKLWKARSGAPHRQKSLTAFAHRVSIVRDEVVAVSNWETGQLRLWDMTSDQEVLLPNSDAAHASALVFDGNRFGVGHSDGYVELWRSDGSRLLHMPGHRTVPRSVMRVAFSPDGKQLASSSYDNTIKLWDLTTGSLIRTLYGHSEPVSRVLFAPDGKRVIASSWDGTVKAWNAHLEPDTLTLQGHEGVVWSVAFGPNGSQLASVGGDGTVRLWDVTTGFSRTIGQHEGQVYAVAISPDGATVVTGGEDGMVRCWDYQSGDMQWAVGHQPVVRSVSFHPDGSQIVTTGDDALVRVYDAVSGKQLSTFSGHVASVSAATYSRDGLRIVSSSRDGTLRVWNAVSGEQIRELSKHTDFVNATAFSFVGSNVVSGGEDNRLIMWDLETGEPSWEAMGLAHDVESVAFSPDAKRVFSAGLDQVVRVWNAASGEELLTLRGHEGLLRCVRVSPDGKTVASCGQDGTIRLWRTSS